MMMPSTCGALASSLLSSSSALINTRIPAKKINIYSNLLNDAVNSFDDFIGVKNGLDNDHLILFKRRCIDIAATNGVTNSDFDITLNFT